MSKQSMPRDERYTPKYIVDAVREALGGKIDFDPFSCAEANKFVRATHYFTKEDDGFEGEWCGRGFANPPFSLMRMVAPKSFSSPMQM